MRTCGLLCLLLATLGGNAARSQTLSIGPSSLSTAIVGQVYFEALTVTPAGTSPLEWKWVGSTPPGLSLSPAQGTISGTPTSAGTYSFTVQVSDSSTPAPLSGSVNYTLTVLQKLSIASSSPLPSGAVGVNYSLALAAVGGLPPYSWSVINGSLPSGLGLDASTGVLRGTPTVAGTFGFKVQVQDNVGGTAVQTFSMLVVPGLSISTSSLPVPVQGQPYSQTLAASGGTPPYSWSVTRGTLPPGLNLSSSGIISGTPTGAVSASFTVQVKDSAGSTATRDLAMQVSGSLAVTSTSPLTPATLSMPYLIGLEASGGLPPYTWAVTQGSLPAGLNLVSASGAISGTPTASGTFNFTVQVTDSVRNTAVAVLTLVVGQGNIPQVTVSGFGPTLTPLDQSSVQIALSAPYASDLTGTAALSFTSSSVVASDDKAIAFSNGTRTIDFRIPAGQTQARFGPTSDNAALLQNGTVAGTLRLTIALEAGGNPVTPAPAPVTATLASAAPAVKSVTATRTQTGFEVTLTGYSTTRELTQATFSFTKGVGSDLVTTDLNVPLGPAAQAWYQNVSSAQWGSQFSIVLPFTLQGNATAVSGVSVTLTNTQGVSNALSAKF